MFLLSISFVIFISIAIHFPTLRFWILRASVPTLTSGATMKMLKKIVVISSVSKFVFLYQIARNLDADQLSALVEEISADEAVHECWRREERHLRQLTQESHLRQQTQESHLRHDNHFVNINAERSGYIPFFLFKKTLKITTRRTAPAGRAQRPPAAANAGQPPAAW